jgi:hypothetical protein
MYLRFGCRNVACNILYESVQRIPLKDFIQEICTPAEGCSKPAGSSAPERARRLYKALGECLASPVNTIVITFNACNCALLTMHCRERKRRRRRTIYM